MPGDYKAPKAGVEWKATKWDGFSIVKTEHKYIHQRGSGRSRCFELAEDGLPIGEWTKKCAKIGYEADFVIGSLNKLSGAKEPGWIMSEKDDEGRTIEQVKGAREIDPAKAEARAQKAAEAAARKAEKAAERAANQEKIAAERAARKAEREAAGGEEKPKKEKAAKPKGKAKAAKKAKSAEADAAA